MMVIICLCIWLISDCKGTALITVMLQKPQRALSRITKKNKAVFFFHSFKEPIFYLKSNTPYLSKGLSIAACNMCNWSSLDMNFKGISLKNIIVPQDRSLLTGILDTEIITTLNSLNNLCYLNCARNIWQFWKPKESHTHTQNHKQTNKSNPH